MRIVHVQFWICYDSVAYEAAECLCLVVAVFAVYRKSKKEGERERKRVGERFSTKQISIFLTPSRRLFHLISFAFFRSLSISLSSFICGCFQIFENSGRMRAQSNPGSYSRVSLEKGKYLMQAIHTHTHTHTDNTDTHIHGQHRHIYVYLYQLCVCVTHVYSLQNEIAINAIFR